jgi:hypothetical protein
MPIPVVVVHDDYETRGLAADTLRAAGYEVAAFDSPMRVLDAMDSPTRIRVLVTRVDFGPGKLKWSSAGAHGQAQAEDGQSRVSWSGAEPPLHD